MRHLAKVAVLLLCKSGICLLQVEEVEGEDSDDDVEARNMALAIAASLAANHPEAGPSKCDLCLGDPRPVDDCPLVKLAGGECPKGRGPAAEEEYWEEEVTAGQEPDSTCKQSD